MDLLINHVLLFSVSEFFLIRKLQNFVYLLYNMIYVYNPPWTFDCRDLNTPLKCQTITCIVTLITTSKNSLIVIVNERHCKWGRQVVHL